jgi:hypothetical protein
MSPPISPRLTMGGFNPPIQLGFGMVRRDEMKISDAPAMQFEPGGEFALADLATGQRHHGADGIDRCRIQFPSIAAQEQADGQEGGALVAIREGMVFRQPEGIGGGKPGNVARPAMMKNIPGPRQRAIHQAFVAHPFDSAKSRKGLGVKKQKGFFLDPDRLCHFARTAKTSR